MRFQLALALLDYHNPLKIALDAGAVLNDGRVLQVIVQVRLR